MFAGDGRFEETDRACSPCGKGVFGVTSMPWTVASLDVNQVRGWWGVVSSYESAGSEAVSTFFRDLCYVSLSATCVLYGLTLVLKCR